MTKRNPGFPMSSSHADLRAVVRRLESMSLKERIELMVRAKLIPQAVALEAIEKLGEKADQVPKRRAIRRNRSRKAADRPAARSAEPTAERKPPEDTSQSAA